MKAISLWQPWATLVALGLKRYETRSWATHYRGPLAIHAAKRKADRYELNDTIVRALVDSGYTNLLQLPYGCIVCTAELLRCDRTTGAVTWGLISDTEKAFGDYSPGRFAWQLYNVRAVDNIPARGTQGFWNWEPPI